VRVLLLSGYELGHQPLHLASPAASLTEEGHEVRLVDLALDPLLEEDLQWAEGVAFSVPMHTAYIIAREAASRILQTRHHLPVVFYGLYATLVAKESAELSLVHAIAGEYEPGLVSWAASPKDPSRRSGVRVEISSKRQPRDTPTALPARHLLPPLDRYAKLSVGGEERLAGYVEASRGCAHRCRHCPVPVVYEGRTRMAGIDALLADIDQLVGMGARHISFGDPDFLNGPHHARRVVEALHGSFPEVTFDATVKIEHILHHEDDGTWPAFAKAGCLFVISAVESASDAILERLAKGHSTRDVARAVATLRSCGIEPRASFVPFTPWTTSEDLRDVFDMILELDLVGNVDPVQLSIRLLVPPGSLLLASGQLTGLVGPYDPKRASYPWDASDPRLDEAQRALALEAERIGEEKPGALEAYDRLRELAGEILGWQHGAHSTSSRRARSRDPKVVSALPPDGRPRLTEAWFCCAEPTRAQLQPVCHAAIGSPSSPSCCTIA